MNLVFVLAKGHRQYSHFILDLIDEYDLHSHAVRKRFCTEWQIWKTRFIYVSKVEDFLGHLEGSQYIVLRDSHERKDYSEIRNVLDARSTYWNIELWLKDNLK